MTQNINMKKLYEQDYRQWAASGNFTQLDIENLVEEVRDLSKRERDRLLISKLQKTIPMGLDSYVI